MTANGAKKAKLKRLMVAFESGPLDWGPLLGENVPSLVKSAVEVGFGDSVVKKARTALAQFMYQEKHDDDRITEASLAVCAVKGRTVEAYLDKYEASVEEVRKNGFGVVREEAGPALMPDFLRANSEEIETLARIQNALADADYLINLLDPRS